jgi:hypothetical protein
MNGSSTVAQYAASSAAARDESSDSMTRGVPIGVAHCGVQLVQELEADRVDLHGGTMACIDAAISRDVG